MSNGVIDVLIINPFDKLPNENFRDQRYTRVYKILNDSERSVAWWSMDYHHWSHSPRHADIFDDGIRLFSVPKYRRNISFSRVLCYIVFSIKVYRALLKLEMPPKYIVALPVPELIFLLSLYCRNNNVKLIIDVTDIWPDLYVRAFPKSVRWLGDLIVKPLHWMANYAYRHCHHLTAVSESYRDDILRRAGSSAVGKESSFFYLGGPELPMAQEEKAIDTINVLFAGQFEFSYDLDVILEAALRGKNDNSKLRFFLAGHGSKLSMIESYIKSHELDNITLLGWLSSEELMKCAAQCHIGLNCYNGFATQSVPTKYFDYLSMGLVVLNSLPGEMASLIEHDMSGKSYKANDIDDFYSKLLLLSSDIERLSADGMRNREIFLKKYSFDKIYNRMVLEIFK